MAAQLHRTRAAVFALAGRGHERVVLYARARAVLLEKGIAVKG